MVLLGKRKVRIVVVVVAFLFVVFLLLVDLLVVDLSEPEGTASPVLSRLATMKRRPLLLLLLLLLLPSLSLLSPIEPVLWRRTILASSDVGRVPRGDERGDANDDVAGGAEVKEGTKTKAETASGP
jgi:hypothetical protein